MDNRNDRENEERLMAKSPCSLPTGTIVTENQRDHLSFGNRRIEVIPFWEWALR